MDDELREYLTRLKEIRERAEQTAEDLRDFEQSIVEKLQRKDQKTPSS